MKKNNYTIDWFVIPDFNKRDCEIRFDGKNFWYQNKLVIWKEECHNAATAWLLRNSNAPKNTKVFRSKAVQSAVKKLIADKARVTNTYMNNGKRFTYVPERETFLTLIKSY